MNAQLAITMVEAAWLSLRKDQAPIGELTAAYNRVSPLAATNRVMGEALQTVRSLHKADDPLVKGKIVAAAEGYGRGAQWYRIDADRKTADEHVRFSVADSISRLASDSAAEIRPSAAAKALRKDLAEVYRLAIKPQLEAVLATHGVPVTLPSELPLSY